MPTRKFCGGSVHSLQDFYDNTTHTDEIQRNMAELFIDKPPIVQDKHLFSFGVETTAGDINVHGAIYALRFLADCLEDKQKKDLIKNRVWLSFQIREVAPRARYVAKPELEMPPL
jgi:hypothetical protein